MILFFPLILFRFYFHVILRPSKTMDTERRGRRKLMRRGTLVVGRVEAELSEGGVNGF
jgi:hypothetical protein